MNIYQKISLINLRKIQQISELKHQLLANFLFVRHKSQIKRFWPDDDEENGEEESSHEGSQPCRPERPRHDLEAWPFVIIAAFGKLEICLQYTKRQLLNI
jgi:hypothetical protein